MSIAAASHTQLDTNPNQGPSPEIDSINDLIVNRATTFPFKPLLAYPGKDGKYVYYTAKELDLFADEAAKHYVESGLVPKVRFSCVLSQLPLMGAIGRPE